MQITLDRPYADHLFHLWFEAMDQLDAIDRLQDLWPVVLQLPSVNRQYREWMLCGFGGSDGNRLDRIEALLDAGYPFSWSEVITVAQSAWPNWCLGGSDLDYDGRSWLKRGLGLLERLMSDNRYNPGRGEMERLLHAELPDQCVAIIAHHFDTEYASELFQSISSFRLRYDNQVRYLAGLLERGWRNIGPDRLLEQIELFFAKIPDTFGLRNNALIDAVRKAGLEWRDLNDFCAFVIRGYQTADSRISGRLREQAMVHPDCYQNLDHHDAAIGGPFGVEASFVEQLDDPFVVEPFNTTRVLLDKIRHLSEMLKRGAESEQEMIDTPHDGLRRAGA